MLPQTLLSFRSNDDAPKPLQDSAANKWVVHHVHPLNSVVGGKGLRTTLDVLQLPNGYRLVCTRSDQAHSRLWLTDANGSALRSDTVPCGGHDLPEYPWAMRIAEAQQQSGLDFMNHDTAMDWFRKVFGQDRPWTSDSVSERPRRFGEAAAACWRDMPNVGKGSKLWCQLDKTSSGMYRMTFMVDHGTYKRLPDGAAFLTLTAKQIDAPIWQLRYTHPQGAGPWGAKLMPGLVWAHWRHTDMRPHLPATIMGDAARGNVLECVSNPVEVDHLWLEALCSKDGHILWSSSFVHQERTATDAYEALQDHTGPVSAPLVRATLSGVHAAAMTADALVAATAQRDFQTGGKITL
jgi:hypothetical protein